MEHAKKLMLVDPRLFRLSMREKTLSKLDEEIEQTLSSDLVDSEKALRYIAALKKYKYYESSKREETEVDVESKILSTIPDLQPSFSVEYCRLGHPRSTIFAVCI